MKQTKKNTEINPFGLPNIVIPAEVLFHPHLTNTEKILFGFINNLSSTPNGCWASNTYLSKLMQSGKQTISNAVSNLSKHNFLIVHHEKRNDGKQVRRIHINPKYPIEHQDHLQQAYKKIYTPLLKNLYPPPKTSNGFIYFLHDITTDRIKIGRALNVANRINSIKNMNSRPSNIQTLRIILSPKEKYKELEAFFHQYYNQYRLHSEWFQLPKEEIQKIKEKDLPIKNLQIIK